MSTATARTALLVLSILLGLLEVADGFRLDLPWMAWLFALLLLGGAYWLTRSEGRGPVILLGALHLIELVMLLLVFRTADQAPPTVLLVVFVVLSAAGTVAAGLTLARRPDALRA
jgi:hypothetical protein